MSGSVLDALWDRPLYPDPNLRLHLLREADYTRPLLEIPPEQKQSILDKLEILYGPAQARLCFPELERILRVYYAHETPEVIASDGGVNTTLRPYQTLWLAPIGS